MSDAKLAMMGYQLCSCTDLHDAVPKGFASLWALSIWKRYTHEDTELQTNSAFTADTKVAYLLTFVRGGTAQTVLLY